MLRAVCCFQDWASLQQQAAITGADALVLVRAVDSPSLACPSYKPAAGEPVDCNRCIETILSPQSRQQQGSGTAHRSSAGTGSTVNCSQAQHVTLAARAQQLVQVDSETDTDAGSSSSSSDEEVPAAAQQQSAHTVTARSRRRFRQRLRAAAAAAAGGQYTPLDLHNCSSGSHTVVAYYGLVVQSMRKHGFPVSGSAHVASGKQPGSPSLMHPLGEADGCFLLKTVQNRDITGCTCTHFTLTHLCQHQALHDQLQNAWLTHS